MKANVSKLVFGNLAGVIDYKKLEKLAVKYDKIRAENTAKPNKHKDKEIQKLKEEMQQVIPETEEELDRIISAYGDSLNNMSEDNEIYTKVAAKSFVSEIEKMRKSIEDYKKMVE
jgi:F0F1-type ATP synthase membrane subunit b/b'